jgi:hypothetical protein
MEHPDGGVQNQLKYFLPLSVTIWSWPLWLTSRFPNSNVTYLSPLPAPSWNQEQMAKLGPLGLDMLTGRRRVFSWI